MIRYHTQATALIAALSVADSATFAGPMGLDVNAPLQAVDTKACKTTHDAFIEIVCPPSALGLDRSDITQIQIDMPISGAKIACRIHVDFTGISEFDIREEVASIYGAPLRELHWINAASINQVIELSLEHTATGLHLDYITEKMPKCTRMASIF